MLLARCRLGVFSSHPGTGSAAFSFGTFSVRATAPAWPLFSCREREAPRRDRHRGPRDETRRPRYERRHGPYRSAHVEWVIRGRVRSCLCGSFVHSLICVGACAGVAHRLASLSCGREECLYIVIRNYIPLYGKYSGARSARFPPVNGVHNSCQRCCAQAITS